MEHHQRLPKKVLSPKAKLVQLIEDLAKDPGYYEPIAPIEWPPLQVFLPGSRKPRHTVYLTKDSVLIRLMTEEALPADSAILCRYGLPTDEYLREVRARLDKARDAIFLGDLDPLDLHVYLSLVHDSVLLKGRPHLKLRYGGINDACLGFCECNLKKGQRLESPMLRMREHEQRHFAMLDSMVDVAAIVGERSRDLLRAGWKLELEGATNAVYFKEGHLSSFLGTVLAR